MLECCQDACMPTDLLEDSQPKNPYWLFQPQCHSRALCWQSNTQPKADIATPNWLQISIHVSQPVNSINSLCFGHE